MTEYRVSAFINGKRVITDKGLFPDHDSAKRYRDETKKFYPNSDPFVIVEEEYDPLIEVEYVD